MQIPVLEQEEEEFKMLSENINLIAQLLESMAQATAELEKAVKNNDVEKYNKYKFEILKFQNQISGML